MHHLLLFKLKWLPLIEAASVAATARTPEPAVLKVTDSDRERVLRVLEPSRQCGICEDVIMAFSRYKTFSIANCS